MTNNRAIIVRRAMSEVERIFGRLVQLVPTFKVLDEAIVPEGLKPHTRSICWLMEQVILQNTKLNAAKWGLKDFEYPPSDISVWDAKFRLVRVPEAGYVFVNVKVGNAAKPSRKNDMGSVKALLNFYESEHDPFLLCAIFKFRFSNVHIVFEGSPLVKNYTWIDEFVVNPRNEHLQAFYECGQTVRTTREFTAEIVRKAQKKGVLGSRRTIRTSLKKY